MDVNEKLPDEFQPTGSADIHPEQQIALGGLTQAVNLHEALPALPDIDEIEPLNEKDQACVEELRSVLERYGALKRFGISLLHEHFPIGEDEIMLEFVDAANRTLTTRPVKLTDDLVENSIETSWRLDSQTGMQRCERLCAKPYGPKGPHYLQHFTTGYTPSE